MAEGAGGGASDVRIEDAELQTLITDVQGMQSTLQSKITRLNSAVDAIEGGWKGSAHGAYDQLQRKANTYADRLNKHLQFLQEALEMSRSGFNKHEMEEMEKFQRAASNSPIADF
ncbi:WXG100 family type VII secretion target [Streptomyces oceani]|uniref:ESAT-6-like protein n=1 Tax=Streptomyces oceani TaxID=1075402 RepID=A0A1E7JTX9_9ACTN|nr:WXG100 family type VII secretion target [Streptomyces oceani]OEU92326.1 hypothetical protein AN216_24720 [Streptomyces oceani]